MKPLDVRPIENSHGIGREVHGLKPQHLKDERVRAELVKLWTDHGLIVFRGVEGRDFHVALSRVFGDIQPHPGARDNGDLPKELTRIIYNPDDADIYEVDGKEIGGWLPWHMDMIYLDKVCRGSILRPVLMPYSGGNTGFIDKIKLYEKLDPALKGRLAGKSIIYQFTITPENLRFARPKSIKVRHLSGHYSSLLARESSFPRVQHPLVYLQSETGRPVLNFSPFFAQQIAELPTSESDQILEELGQMCLDESNSYYHEWRADDMVLWDNWRMLHRAAGVPVDCRRIMERTQIVGDYGLGRLTKDAGIIEDSMRVTV
jgi:taurine dioxygenase